MLYHCYQVTIKLSISHKLTNKINYKKCVNFIISEHASIFQAINFKQSLSIN